MTTDTTATLTFEPPGPGTWERDLSHCPPSATLVYRRVASTTMTEAYRGIFAEWGAPLDTMEVQFVHGKMYRRLVPLVGADRSSAPPPRPVLWLATRLHPAFRRRERLARRTLAERPYLDEIDAWHGGERAGVGGAQPRPAGRRPRRTGRRRARRAPADGRRTCHRRLDPPPPAPRQRSRPDRRPARPRHTVGARARSPCSVSSTALRRHRVRDAAMGGASSTRCVPPASIRRR